MNTVELSGKKYEYSINWEGQKLSGCVLALDTETTVVESGTPDLVLTTVSNGKEHYIISNDKIIDFINLHHNYHFIFFNIAFDFWVLQKFYTSKTSAPFWITLGAICEANRAHDGMLLDALYRLGLNDTYPSPRNLGIVAKIYANMDIDKEDPYRMRYSEILGQNFSKVDVGFLDYAMKDTIATYFSYVELWRKAKNLALRSGVSNETMKKYGVLTEAIQIKGALALYKITENGITLDLTYGNKLHDRFLQTVNHLIDEFSSKDEFSGLFKRHKKTNDILFSKTGGPQKSNKALQAIFENERAKMEKEYEIKINVPLTPKGKVSTSLVGWGDYIAKSEFLQKYDTFVENCKLCQFFSKHVKPTIHPRFNYFVRTGRTSCQTPNIQQWPKGAMRDMIIASPGHLLVCIDYSFIELRTLAYVMEKMFKKSTMADVIRSGKDPHAWTGALINNMEYEDFLNTKKTKPDFFKKWRQNSKPLNFGVPGGLSATSLLNYAKNVYYLKDWTLDMAKTLRDNLIYTVYPELALYLNEDPVMILATNMDCSVKDLWEAFDWTGEKAWYVISPIKNIVKGISKKSGEKYTESFIGSVWDKLERLNNNITLIEPLKKREGSLDLFKQLFWDQVQTTTGRIRGKVSFTQCKNTQFQGIAADGAKMALWRLIKEGYRLVNFIHDEIVFELPIKNGGVDKDTVDYLLKVMCEEMHGIIPTIPVEGEYIVNRCWKKDAKNIIQDNLIIPIG